MGYETIMVTKEDGVATITLNRPEAMNSVNEGMLKELVEVTQEVGDDEAVKVVVLTGAGRAFCAGGDLEAPMYKITNSAEMRRLIVEFGKIPLNLRNMPKPVIAAVNGAAVGAGLGFALAADIIIASEKARFGHVYRNIGLMSDCGSIYFLPRLIGVSKACEIIFTGKVIDAGEAERLGITNQVVPADQLEAVTKELAVKLAKGPSVAIGLAKMSLYQGLGMDLPTAIEWEARAHAICMLGEDMQEGIKAFKEKREPVFKGR